MKLHPGSQRYQQSLLIDIHLFTVCHSMVFSSYLDMSDFLMCYFSDENHQVVLYKNSAWNIRGHYETAMEDDYDAMWMHHDGEDVLQILVVSTLL